jgi:hypothetical protein
LQSSTTEAGETGLREICSWRRFFTGSRKISVLIRFVDQDGNEIPVGGEGPSPSIDEDPPSTEHF